MNSILESKKLTRILLGCAGLLAIGVAVALVILVETLLKLTDGGDVNKISLSNMHILGESAILYAADDDDLLPPAHIWMDSLTPFTPLNSHPFHSIALQKQKPNPDHYGIAFIQPFSSFALSKVEIPAQQPLQFESTLLDRNAFGDLTTLPNPGRYRVQGKWKNPLAYADGHVGWIDNQFALKPFPVIKGNH